MQNQSDPASCPVEKLLDEAEALAAIWRFLVSAREDATRPDEMTVADVFKHRAPEGAKLFMASDVMREVRQRLDALAALAPHYTATSLRGAAFLAVLVAREGSGLSLIDGVEMTEEVNDFWRTLDRCSVSILAHLGSACRPPSEDLMELFGLDLGHQPSTIMPALIALPLAA